jgi:hypothetical protein
VRTGAILRAVSTRRLAAESAPLWLGRKSAGTRDRDAASGEDDDVAMAVQRAAFTPTFPVHHRTQRALRDEELHYTWTHYAAASRSSKINLQPCSMILLMVARPVSAVDGVQILDGGHFLVVSWTLLISSQEVLHPLLYRHISFWLSEGFRSLCLFEQNILSNPLMGSRIHTLELSLPHCEIHSNEQQFAGIMNQTRNILPHATRLQELRIFTPSILDTIIPSLAHTLVLLHTQYDAHVMQYVSSIGQLRKLRSLQLKNLDAYNVDWSAVPPFDLPELEEIKWYGSEHCDGESYPIEFLVHCRLPALRTLHLVMMLEDEPGMEGFLGKFLHKHPSVDHVGLALDGDYDLLKSVEVKHVDLSWCAEYFDVWLLDHLPSTARILSLPVHVSANEEVHACLYAALEHLLAIETDILEVRLFARVEITIPRYSVEDEGGLCFREQDGNNWQFTPPPHIFGILHYYARRLETVRQIVLRDDHLMSFKDHGM